MKINSYINSPKKFNIEELIQFVAQRLNISEDVELSLVYKNRLLDMFSKNMDCKAILIHPREKQYILMLKEDVTGLQYIICHEMVHLKQYESGDLKMKDNYKILIWKGVEYDNTSEYDNREWEIEAFDMQDKLWKEFKKQQ